MKLKAGQAYKFKRKSDGVVGCGHAIIYGGGILFADISFPDQRAMMLTAEQLEHHKIEVVGELDLGNKPAKAEKPAKEDKAEASA